jgi:acyl-CoA thioester hydrolase
MTNDESADTETEQAPAVDGFGLLRLPDGRVGDRLSIRVRYSETDQMGFVYHANYLSYFEMGRIEMLRKQGISYREIEQSGTLIVVYKVEIRYKTPARYDDELVLETTLERMTGARIDHSYRLTRADNGEPVCEGNTTLACVDRTGKLCPVPDVIRGRKSAGPAAG